MKISLITEDPKDSTGREIRIMTPARWRLLQSKDFNSRTCAKCRKPFVEGGQYVQAKRAGLFHIECIEKINERERNNRGPAIARDGGKARYKKGGRIYSNKWSARVKSPDEMNK